jgi:hypothetical protein
MAVDSLVQSAQRALALAQGREPGWEQAARDCYAQANAEAVRSNDAYLGLAAAFLHDTLKSPEHESVVEALQGMGRALARDPRRDPAAT